MVVKYSGIAGKRGYAPKKIVLHNDEGSQNANSAFYKRWLETHDPEKGYAHYYVADDGTYQAEKDENCAWHCGNSVGNRDYIGIEVCQSQGNEATFRANEQKAFKLAYDLCQKYNISMVASSFPLHRELSSTVCPHRSWQLHGQSVQMVKQYFATSIAGKGIKDGWSQVNGKWQYIADGQLCKDGWRNIDGKWYAFDADGWMLTGWYAKGDKWYYLTPQGSMHTGWSLVDGKWYLLGSDGVMVEGWTQSGDKWYYLQASGVMAQGWLQDKSGAWYYLNIPDGEMVTGVKSIDGKRYEFDSNGKCLNP